MKDYQSGGSTPPAPTDPKDMTPAELAAFRRNPGKSTIDLLKEDKEKTIRKKMESMPPMPMPAPGDSRPGVSMSEESRKMIEDTNAGYEYTKKKPFKSGGSVGSASKRADGCAVRGKTKGMMR
jgi:hypothetical protein